MENGIQYGDLTEGVNFEFVGTVTAYTLENIVIDNYLFGVASVATDGNESVVSFPSGPSATPRRGQ